MIDPGHPFSVPYADVVASLEDRVRHGTEQPAPWRFVYQNAISAYELPREARSITSVSGLSGTAYIVFTQGVDYVLANNRLRWIDGGRRPVDLARVDVEYTYREAPSGLTDFNEGSVVSTLMRAVAREMKVIYEQMDQAYRRAFIDVATGPALDGVVALLGIVRNPAIAARGSVTYVRRSTAKGAVTIPAGSRVAEPGGRTFRTLVDAVIALEHEEMCEPDEAAKVVVHTTERIVKLVGVWPLGADPLPQNALTTTPTAPGRPFGADERTITLTAPPAAPQLRVRYRPKSVTVQVEAVLPGPEGNLGSGSITVMPTPPTGVMGVSNANPLLGGRPAEPDDQLRERAKHALERAGNATLNALRFGVLDVDGIDEVEVIDHAADPSLALGEVRLRYSASGDLTRVKANVDAAVGATRAAGIRVVAELITTVPISGKFYLVAHPDASAAAAPAFLDAVVEEIDRLTIGAPLSVRRLNAHVYGVAGLADVLEAQLLAKGSRIGDPYVVSNAELVRADRDELHAVVLQALHASKPSTSGAGTASAVTTIAIQIVDGAGTALVAIGTVTLKVVVEITAGLANAPTQGPVRVGEVERDIVLQGSSAPSDSTATLKITAADYPAYHADQHTDTLVATISAAAYPGLTPATAAFPA